MEARSSSWKVAARAPAPPVLPIPIDGIPALSLVGDLPQAPNSSSPRLLSAAGWATALPSSPPLPLAQLPYSHFPLSRIARLVAPSLQQKIPNEWEGEGAEKGDRGGIDASDADSDRIWPGTGPEATVLDNFSLSSLQPHYKPTFPVGPDGWPRHSAPKTDVAPLAMGCGSLATLTCESYIPTRGSASD
jgi:hypothetical protein